MNIGLDVKLATVRHQYYSIREMCTKLGIRELKMDDRNIKRKKGICENCYKPNDLLYGVNLREFITNRKWQSLIFVCTKCKEDLRGNFKYDRG